MLRLRPTYGTFRADVIPSDTPMSQLTPLLTVDNVSLSFGGNAALSEVSFDVQPGEIRAIIGPNGAGKTSILNCISGFYRPQKGRILFKGQSDLTLSLIHISEPTRPY